MRNSPRLWLGSLLLFSLIPALNKHADAAITLLPDSHHQLYETYGLFIENQMTLVNYGAGRAWGAVGGTLAVAGDPENEHHPEIVAWVSANAGMHYNDNWRIFTETIDARLGFAAEYEFAPDLRLSVGIEHFSGHAADGIGDPSLLEPTLGEELLPIRLVYDYDGLFRTGATFKPYILSAPKMNFFAADQFLEIFPLGTHDLTQSATPFVALSFEEYGNNHDSLDTGLTFTFHVQGGVYWGSHLNPKAHPTLRLVAGYYNGADPRLKYFQFQGAKSEFGYLGVMIDL